MAVFAAVGLIVVIIVGIIGAIKLVEWLVRGAQNRED